MKVDEMERLITAFYDGKTTEQEEAELKQALLTEDVPMHLLKERKLFSCYFVQADDEECNYPIPTSLEQKLNDLLDERMKREKRSFTADWWKHNWRWIGGIAASILLVVGIAVRYDYSEVVIKEHKDTFTNPEEAYQVLKETLIEVSENLNQGIDLWCEVQQEVEENNLEIRNIINKQ